MNVTIVYTMQVRDNNLVIANYLVDLLNKNCAGRQESFYLLEDSNFAHLSYKTLGDKPSTGRLRYLSGFIMGIMSALGDPQ